MKKTIFLMAAFVMTATLFTGCAEQKPQSTEEWKAEHVFLIGLDGWGAYSVEKAEMPIVKDLMKNGCYTLKKRSVLPSSSAINWASMFMGVGTELHGYTEWDSKTPEIPSRVVDKKGGISPTVFRVLRETEPNAEIVCMSEWDGIKYLVDSLAVEYEQVEGSEELCEAACERIKASCPTLMAIVFDQPDAVGHKIGHDTPEYYDILKMMDVYIGKIIDTLKEAGVYDDSILIFSADHGGIGRGHGGKTLLELETPFIISGKNVRKGGEFEESMMQFDVAATIAYIFGLEQPQVWIGRPMTQVFE